MKPTNFYPLRFAGSRSILSAAFFILMFCQCKAQSVHWQWARQGTSPNNFDIYQQATQAVADPLGPYVYVTGYYSDTAYFGPYHLYGGPAKLNAYIAKYDTSGNLIWAKTSFSDGDVTPYSITADSMGNFYLVGMYALEVSFAPLTVQQPLGNVFLAKFDAQGNALWIATSYGHGTGCAVSCDARGNPYISGYYWGDSIKFGNVTLPPTLNANGYTSSFVTRYDVNGNVVWAKASTGAGEQHGSGIAVDKSRSDGLIFATGTFSSPTITLGNITLSKSNNVSGSYNFFIAAYDTTGHIVWAKSADGEVSDPSNDYLTHVTADINGNAFVTGTFRGGAMVFDGDTLYNVMTAQDFNFFLVKFNAAGTVLWKKAGGNANGRSIALDGAGNLYLLAGNHSNAFYFDGLNFYHGLALGTYAVIFKCDTNGRAMASAWLPDGGDGWAGITANAYGSVFFTGDFSIDTLTIAHDTLCRFGWSSAFITRFDFGSQACHLSPVSVSADTSLKCFVDTVQVCGPPGFVTYAWNTGQTNQCFNTDVPGNYFVTVTDNFNCSTTSNLVKLNLWAMPPIHIIGDTVVCGGQPVLLGTSDGGAYIYSWSNGMTTPTVNATGGMYFVTVTNAFTCQATDSIFIKAAAAPVASITLLHDTLFAAGGSFFQWYLDGDSIGTGPFYIPVFDGRYTVAALDSNGCSDISSPLIISGVEKLIGNGITVMPNPSADNWYLTAKENLAGAQVELYDVSGKLVSITRLQSGSTLINPAVSGGLYTLKVFTTNAEVKYKLVKY